MSKHMCKASEKKVHVNAEKAEALLAAGLKAFKCEKCGRMSHKEDHLCKPVKIKSAPAAAPAPAIETAPVPEPAE